MRRKIIYYFQIYHLTLSGLIFLPALSLADDKTKIIIIGTVHKSTVNFDSDSLVNILNSINPDVILVECDTSYMTPDFKLKNWIKYLFPETQAITEYTKNRSVELRPYDITGRDMFLNDYKRKRYERNFFSDITSLSRAGKLNNEATEVLNKVLATMSIANEMANEKVSYINNHEGSWKIDTINYYTYSGLDKLIDTTPELSVYKPYWDEEQNYWEKRNNVMLENILTYKNQFVGKKIVVLCGYSHKNILKEGLLKKGIEISMVKEFWEK